MANLSKDLIFSVFLPPLVVRGCAFYQLATFKKDLPVIALLATVGVALAAAVTAVGMHFVLDWDWSSAIYLRHIDCCDRSGIGDRDFQRGKRSMVVCDC